jgi:hypothetical protein
LGTEAKGVKFGTRIAAGPDAAISPAL